MEPLVVRADGTLGGTLGSVELDEALVGEALEALDRGSSRTVEIGGGQRFLEVYPPRPRLVIVGAVPVAIALVRLARELGYETVVVDGRRSFATDERFPDADVLLVGWLDELADEIELGPADAVAVLSHDAKLDEPAIVTAFARGCRYVGAIGSRGTQRGRRERLMAAGLTETELARLRGPIGLDLGGRDAAETALAVLSEVVAERRGGSARPLSAQPLSAQPPPSVPPPPSAP
jgi:xanthine dehydrogenase accessory factor